MNVIFICGPYRGKEDIDILKNIIRAEGWARKFWADGLAVICPHKNSSFMSGEIPEEKFLEGYLEILSRCDILFAMPGWEKSEGARAEVKEARRLRMDIIYG